MITFTKLCEISLADLEKYIKDRGGILTGIRAGIDMKTKLDIYGSTKFMTLTKKTNKYGVKNLSGYERFSSNYVILSMVFNLPGNFLATVEISLSRMGQDIKEVSVHFLDIFNSNSPKNLTINVMPAKKSEICIKDILEPRMDSIYSIHD